MTAAEDRRLVVLGAGGHAKVVLATALAGGWQGLSLYDDDPAKHGMRILGVPVAGNLPAPGSLDGVWLLAGFGSNARRAEMALRYPGAHWATVLHPSAQVHASVRLGEGTVVFAGAVIQPDALLGCHVILNTGATVDHDCQLGDFVHVAPGSHLAGGVRLDPGTFMGIGSVAIPGVHIGAGCVVGAGAVVVRDLQPNLTAVGVPARPTGGRAAHWLER
jgi:sugar O-acyltransferase (sialic acid O-acetyltransferase NeuD family)